VGHSGRDGERDREREGKRHEQSSDDAHPTPPTAKTSPRGGF